MKRERGDGNNTEKRRSIKNYAIGRLKRRMKVGKEDKGSKERVRSRRSSLWKEKKGTR